jgi:NAD+-processing family protein with receiver domain
VRILFLDDDPKRHELFARAHIGHQVTFVWGVFDAVRALGASECAGEPFDYACLDHDLGGHQMVESGEATGYEVAQHIAFMTTEARPRRVVVHSFNPVGAQNMVRLLADAGVPCIRAPFGTFRIPDPSATVAV